MKREETEREEAERRLDEVLAGYLEAQDRGRARSRDELVAAHPELEPELLAYFADQDRVDSLAAMPAVGAGALPAAEEVDLPVGSVLGPYRIEAVIGRGGMGTIYCAVHTSLGRQVAVKVLTEALGKDQVLVDRFRREARALARLDHPHIVRIHDMGAQGELYYFVMEYVDGVNLRQVMETGELNPSQALGLVPKICQALEYAHENGVVHRDIKPENILVDREGEPKIADFGLARVLAGESQIRNLTRTDVVMGTFNYMAPEQQRSSTVDHRADIYALGVVLYEMLTGELPVGHFAPPSRKVRGDALDTRVDDVVLKALESEPERRYQRASHMGRAVSDVISGPAAPAGDGTPRSAAGGGAAGGGAPERELAVVRLVEGGRLGGGRASWIQLVHRGEEALEVRGWSRNEIGVRLEEGQPRIAPIPATDAAGAGLRLGFPDSDATVYVPAGVAVEIECPEAEVSASGLRGALQLAPGSGEATVSDHEGPLRAERIADGELWIEGLSSAEAELRTQAGTLTASGLRLSGGGLSARSQEGDVRLGFLENRSSFRYEAQSLSGTVQAKLGEVSEKDEHRAVGSVGLSEEGAGSRGLGGRLVVATGSGGVKLLGHAALRQQLYLESLAAGFIPSAIMLGVFLWIGFDLAVMVILIIWGVVIIKRTHEFWVARRA